MREGHASGTAKLVACWRALADAGVTSVPGFRDPAARHMLDRRWQRLLEYAAAYARRLKPLARRDLLQHLDMIVLRVAYIDALLAELKPAQVVILGAGLDTRAWRLPVLQGVRVFEVDHPATQAYKRERAAGLAPPLAQHTFAAVDFPRDDLAGALAAVGFDPNVPTCWLWEGVIMYLDDAALRGTLQVLRKLSAAGSTLIAHYHQPGPADRVAIVRKLVLSWLGEPQIGLRTSSALRGELERAGFEVASDAGLPEQAAKVHAVASTRPGPQVSRIMVARG